MEPKSNLRPLLSKFEYKISKIDKLNQYLQESGLKNLLFSALVVTCFLHTPLLYVFSMWASFNPKIAYFLNTLGSPYWLIILAITLFITALLTSLLIKKVREGVEHRQYYSHFRKQQDENADSRPI